MPACSSPLHIHTHACLAAGPAFFQKQGWSRWMSSPRIEQVSSLPKIQLSRSRYVSAAGCRSGNDVESKRMLVAKVLTIALDICDANCESPIGTVLELADGGVVCPALKENSLNGLALSLASGLYPASLCHHFDVAVNT